MQWDYVYADLQLEVMFDADTGSPFFNLTDTEVNTLQQLVYMTLNNFLYTKAGYAKTQAEFLKHIQGEYDMVRKKPDGG